MYTHIHCQYCTTDLLVKCKTYRVKKNKTEPQTEPQSQKNKTLLTSTQSVRATAPRALWGLEYLLSCKI